MFGRATIRLGIGPHSSIFLSSNLSDRRLDVYHTSTGTHDVALTSANLECRSEMCCIQLAGNAGPKKIPKNLPSGHHRTTLSGYIFATKARVDNQKKHLLNSNVFPTCLHNMVNFGPLATEIRWRVWVAPANFNGFRVLAALLHGTPVLASAKLCGFEQRVLPMFSRVAAKQ